MNPVKVIFKNLFRFHFLGSMIIMLTVVCVISVQISDRTTFADTELYQDVIDRWGAPITQPSPSVLFVHTGSVFTDLNKLPLSSQTVKMDAVMNYRKRGLAYFSGFNFNFSGEYSIENTQNTDIDIVFVFPINLHKNKVLLSDLAFYVNNTLTNIGLSETSDKLVWTGRLEDKKIITFKIEYKGRGLDQFTYVLDPSLPVKNFIMTSNITGGTNYDYARDVIPAADVEQNGENNISLTWRYKSLESGIPMGLILPSEKSFSMIIATMTERSWATFILFFSGIAVLSLYFRKSLKSYETYLIAACYGFFFVLLAYLAAFIHFYLAYFASLVVISSLLYLYISRTISSKAGIMTVGLIISFLLIPTMAVILQGYTGLIYTLEILAGLGMLMWLTTRKPMRNLIEEFFSDTKQGGSNEM